MKLFPGLVLAFCGLLTGCLSTEPDTYTVYPKWNNYKPLLIVGCKRVVSYNDHSIGVQGIDIPVPKLGGDVKVGGFDYKPQTLNTLYRNVAILDSIRVQYCADRVAAAQDSHDAYSACNARLLQQEEKINYLALSVQGGEAAVEKAIDKYGEPSSSGTMVIPQGAGTKKVDANAIAAVQQAANAAMGNGNIAGPAGPTPITSSAPHPIPVNAAREVKSVPATTLLKIARQPVAQ